MKLRSICRPPQYGSHSSRHGPSYRWMQRQASSCGGCSPRRLTRSARRRHWCMTCTRYSRSRTRRYRRRFFVRGTPIRRCQRHVIRWYRLIFLRTTRPSGIARACSDARPGGTLAAASPNSRLATTSRPTSCLRSVNSRFVPEPGIRCATVPQCAPEPTCSAFSWAYDALAAHIVSRGLRLLRQRRRSFSAGNRKSSVKEQRRKREECRCLSHSEPCHRAANRGDGDPGQNEAHPERPAPNRHDRDPDDRGRSCHVSDDREDSQREVVEVLLCLGDLVAAHGNRQRLGDRRAGRQADVEQDDRNHPAPPGEQQRPRPEKGRRQPAAAAYARSDADQARSSGARRARQRPASLPASRSANNAAAKARRASIETSVVTRPHRRARGASLRPMAEKRYLFTPGPTPVPPQVLEAMSRPIIHHRSSDFREILGRTLERLRQVYRTSTNVLVYTSSGTGGMESAISNLTRPGDRVAVVSAGHFGERWGEMAKNFGCEVDRLDYEWGETPVAEDLAGRLGELGGAKVVFLTHSETSTGVVADVQALAAAAKDAGALVVVDAVSSLGAVPLETDAWGLDAVVSGSQKALMTPPGLATVSVSADGWRAVQAQAPSRYYFDWEQTKERQDQFDPAFTPAVSIVVGLDVALGLLLDEGLEQAFERHARLGRACREGVKAMGLELFSPDDDRSAVVP